MGRIRDAYEEKFRRLLQRVGLRRVEFGVAMLLDRAERLARRRGLTEARALALVYCQTCERLSRRYGPEVVRGLELPRAGGPDDLDAVAFVCDAGLGGLARWLRAAGYEAHWQPNIDDDELIRQARTIPAILLTTDSLLMQRGVLRDGLVPALWVPPSLKKTEQLKLVLSELQLPVRDPRCMSCGGELVRVDKEAVKDRIPPKTYRWLDEYWLCRACGKLLWEGTHWERIERTLDDLNAADRDRADGQANGGGAMDDSRPI